MLFPDLVTPDRQRGRRSVLAVAVGGTLVTLAPRIGTVVFLGIWNGAVSDVLGAAAFLGLGVLLYRGHAWTRPLAAAVLWLCALLWAVTFMMAGGPLMFRASAAARAQGVLVVAALASSITLAVLARSRHVRGFMAAQHDARGQPGAAPHRRRRTASRGVHTPARDTRCA
jgi:hypothetical protein